MFTAPEKAAMAHKVWVSLQKKEVSTMFQYFHSLFHSLLITYNIAASYEEENSTQTQERHGKVDAVLVLIVPGIGIGNLNKMVNGFYSISFGHFST